jgi:hypothetical protein
MGGIRPEEEFVMKAIAAELSGRWETPAKDPPDAFLTIDGDRKIAVEITRLTQNVPGERGGKPRLTDDAAGMEFVDDLNLELSDLVPNDQTLVLRFSVPMSKLPKTKVDLTKFLRQKLVEKHSFTAGTDVEFNGNKFNIRTHLGKIGAHKIFGTPLHSGSNPDISFNVKQMLEERIIAKAKKRGKIKHDEVWLALLNNYPLAGAVDYKHAPLLNLLSNIRSVRLYL